jgi:hypothetical protein
MSVRRSPRSAAALAALAALALLPALGAAGCASRAATAAGGSPVRREFAPVGDQVVLVEPTAALTRHEPVGVSADQAWQALPLAYEALGLTLTLLDGERRRVGAGGMRVQGRLKGAWMSRYVNCGTATNGLPPADSYAITLDVLSQVSGRRDGPEADVSTAVRAVGRPTSVSSSNAINCVSTGALERRIAELTQEQAAKAP